tara:strand:- start:3127 stop:3867 length:741 start_codon:yes stop_codon:yes gene_type:complete
MLDRVAGNPTFTCSDPSLALDETNLCLQAAEALKKEVGPMDNISIHLEKRIPVGAGLGGGSSDAAATIKGINTLFDLKLSEEKQHAVAVSLGADVPFFLNGGCQYGTGIGDQLSAAKIPVIGAILLVVPPIKVSTEWAYKAVKNALPGGFGTGNFSVPFQVHAEWDNSGALFENDFESLVFQTYPEIGDLKRRLISAGAKFASLSGSGSTVFGIFEDSADAELQQQQFSSFQSFIAYPVSDLSDLS